MFQYARYCHTKHYPTTDSNRLLAAGVLFFQSCKPLSIYSFRVIVILLSLFSIGSCVSVFNFLCVGKFFKTISLCVCWLCYLFDKALVVALACAALVMCLQK